MMNCQVIGDTGSVSHASAVVGGSLCSNESKNINGSSEVVSGWMYLNELGQMCGPYISQQLLDGLSSGFLPDDLPVYPVMNGALMVAVPLKLFKENPNHVSTGFTYLGRPIDTASTDTGTNVEQQQPLTWENKCWIYLDGYGKPAGPYSLTELYYWHQYGYLPDSVMIRHVENKSSPSTLLSLINSCHRDNLHSGPTLGHVNSGHAELISKVSEEIGSELHSGIKKKARILLKTEQDSNGSRSHFLKDKNNKVGVEERNGFAPRTALVGCHDVSTPQYSANSWIEEPTKSIGGVENFLAAKTVVSQRLFNCCREVLWNAVFYDLVSNCAHSWKKGKRWSHRRMDEVIATSKQSTSVQMISDVIPQARESDSADDDLDCPPGFENIQENYSLCKLSLPSYSNSAENNLSTPRSSVCVGSSDYVDREKTIARVQEELFLASKASILQRESNSTDDELDCPPGFENIQENNSLCKLSLPSCFNSVENNVSAPQSSLSAGSPHHVEREKTIAKVQEELFLASKASMVDDSPPQGLSSPHQPDLNPCQQPSFDFLGSSFSKLGAPCSIAVDGQAPDEPPPPGVVGLITEPCPQHLPTSFLNQLRKFSDTMVSTKKDSVGSYEDCSTEFIGRGFKRLGMPLCGPLDNQRTDEPPPPGSQSSPGDMFSSGKRKFRQLVLDVSIPKWGKFVILALCRQKLHDDVLREWKISFHDGLRDRLEECDQAKTSLGSEKMPNFPRVVEPELSLLTERSKSCHSSGPPEISVVEFTYSRRKVSRMLPTPVPLKDSQSSKREKPSRKKLARAEALGLAKDKNAANQLCLKEEVSASKTSKVGGSAKRKVTKNVQSVKSLKSQKRQRVAEASPSIAAKDYVKSGVEKVAGGEMDSISNDTGDLGSNSKVTRKDKIASDRLHLKKNSSDISKLKRKCVTDESLSPPLQLKAAKLVKSDAKQASSLSPPLQLKAAKLVKIDAKQASSKKIGKGRTQTSKSKDSCPVSSGCARSSIDGWKWRRWSLSAKPAERARVRGIKLSTVHHFGSDSNTGNSSHAKGISARTNRVKLRNLLAAAEGAEILKASQLNARKKRLRFQRSKIHDWGLIALEPIEAEDFVIEYVGELIRPGISDIREREYEKMGIGSSYLFRLDDGYVVDATKRGGVARFINHSCEPNCYTKTVTVDGQKRIFIYAKRHVASGEEITYNYKFPLEDKKIPCNCGAKRCRGSMN